ncbi:grainyhead-like, partial [Dissophora ornata]
GAERKNKDDHKHLEKMWDKMRGKNADTNPLVNMLAPVQSVSLFSECMDHPEGSGEDETLDLSETLAHDPEADTAVEAGSGGGGGGNGAGSGDGFDVASGSSSRQDSEPFSGDHHSSSGGSLVPVNKKRRRATENGGNALTSGSHNNNNNNNNNNNASSGNNNNSSSNNNNNSSNQRGLYVDPTQSQVGFASSAAASALSSSSTSSTSLTAALVSSSEMFLDRDPNYVAPARKKRPVLCLYIKIGGESVYRAVYLEKYTLADLTQKLSEKLEIQSSTISSVYRKTTTKKELVVRVDDAMVAQMTDELDMVVEYEFNQQDGNVDLTLKY